MNKLKRFTTALLLLAVFTLTACVTIYRFYEMIALVNGHDVAFTLPEEDLADKEVKFMLYDIGVDRSDVCAKDCGGWEMVRSLDNTDLIEENFVKFPIKYGVTLPNMQTRVHKELRKGKYSVGARFALIKNGKVIDSRKVVATEFTIE